MSVSSALDAIRFTSYESFTHSHPRDSYRVLPGHSMSSYAVVATAAKPAQGAWTHVQPLSEHMAQFVCDGCDAYFAPNQRRFRCADCMDFDLCEACFYAPRAHPPEHAFYVVCRSVHLPCRGLLPDQTSLEVVPLDRLRVSLPHLYAEIPELDRVCFGAHAWPMAQVERYNTREGKHSDALVAKRRDVYGRTETALAALVLSRFDNEESFAHIDSLAVSPAWQGRGVGDLCITHVFTRARMIGLRNASLHVDPQNTRALALYMKRGFLVADLIDDYYGYDTPGYLMHAPLSE